MSLFTHTTRNLILKIDEFIDQIEIGLIVFREGMKAYLEKDDDGFMRHLQKVDALENHADRLQREIENEMITNSVLPQHRDEVFKLIDSLDEIIDSIKRTLNEIELEQPDIPGSLNKDFLSLTETSAICAEELIPAARAFFRAPYTVREKLLKVYYYESETDKISMNTKRKIFREMPEIELAGKAHLRYIVHHIEGISDEAQSAADLLASMAIKVVM